MPVLYVRIWYRFYKICHLSHRLRRCASYRAVVEVLLAFLNGVRASKDLLLVCTSRPPPPTHKNTSPQHDHHHHDCARFLVSTSLDTLSCLFLHDDSHLFCCKNAEQEIGLSCMVSCVVDFVVVAILLFLHHHIL
jgi:hypothetical protein